MQAGTVARAAGGGQIVGAPRSAVVSRQQRSVSGRMEELKSAGRTAFIPYLCAGDPDLATTSLALKALDEVSDVLEVGVPYNDTLADGPVIQSAASRALRAGTTMDGVLEMLANTCPELSSPVVLFTYYNPLLSRGLDSFCRDCKEAGAAALLVPDLPLEETDSVRQACQAVGLELILLTAPTTPRERMLRIARSTQGFLYLVSVTGVTGMRDQLEGRVQDLVHMLHQLSDKPVAVGFGISKPEHCAKVASWGADGIIVGSRLVQLLGEAKSPTEGLQAMKALAQELRASIS